MEAFTTDNKIKVVKNMRGLIVSNGDITNYEKLSKVFRVSDFVICADGGIRHLMKIHQRPDLVLGDFDSISRESIEYIEREDIKTEKHTPIKDKTDTELAMDYLIEIGCSEISLIGATGSRQDHSIANILLLAYLLEKEIKGIVYDDKNTIYLIDDQLCLKREEKTFVSIIPISDTGIVLSISGFYYDLDKVFIPFASTHGVSNEIIEDFGKIKVHRGKALVIQSVD